MKDFKIKDFTYINCLGGYEYEVTNTVSDIISSMNAHIDSSVLTFQLRLGGEIYIVKSKIISFESNI